MKNFVLCGPCRGKVLQKRKEVKSGMGFFYDLWCPECKRRHGDAGSLSSVGNRVSNVREKSRGSHYNSRFGLIVEDDPAPDQR